MEPAPGGFRIEALLAHRAWMERTARALVRGDAEAGDLVQDAWVGILERPPAAPPRSPRAWLAAVLRFRAVDRTRAAASRRRREEASAPPAAADPGPAEVVARAEIAGRVARLVLDLEEPFRTTILLRYYEGLPTPAIAERTGVPAGTVRTRLHRGLERLRERLDGESGGERRRWVLLLAPILGGAPPGSDDAKGGPAMPAGTRLAMAGAAAALGIVAWVAWETTGSPSPALPPGNAIAAASPAAAPPADPASSTPAPIPPAVLRPAAPPGSPGPPSPPDPAPRGPDAALLARLEAVAFPVKFDGATLQDVLQFLSSLTGVEFVVEEEAAERVQRAIVHLTRENSTVPALLDELLSFDPSLRWEAREGKVRILGRKP